MARVTTAPCSPFPPQLCSQPPLPPCTLGQPKSLQPLQAFAHTVSAYLSSQGFIIASENQEPPSSSHSKKSLGYAAVTNSPQI